MIISHFLSWCKQNRKEKVQQGRRKMKLNLWKLFLIFPSYISISYDTHKQIVKIEWKSDDDGEKIECWQWSQALTATIIGDCWYFTHVYIQCRPMCSSFHLEIAPKVKELRSILFRLSNCLTKIFFNGWKFEEWDKILKYYFQKFKVQFGTITKIPKPDFPEKCWKILFSILSLY